MNVYKKAHQVLQKCNNLNFFNRPEIEECKAVWLPIQKKLESNQAHTLLEVRKEEQDTQKSITYLAMMFGKGNLLEEVQ